MHRFTPAARYFIAAMDGERTVQQLWELANRQLGEDAPTQDEVIRLLGQLHAADLLQSDVTPDVAELFERGRQQERASGSAPTSTDGDPPAPVGPGPASSTASGRWSTALWSRWGGLAVAGRGAAGAAAAALHWAELTGNFSDRVLAPATWCCCGWCSP